MALEISTVGAKVKYAVEGASPWTRPTSGYTTIPDVNTAPEISLDPSTIDASNITDKITRYIKGRVDPGGVQNFTLNHTADVKSKWAAAVTAYAQKAPQASMWCEYAFPNGDSVFFKFRPLPISTIPGIDQNSLSTLQAPFLVEGKGVFAASST